MLPALDKKIILFIVLVLVVGLIVGYVIGVKSSGVQKMNYTTTNSSPQVTKNKINSPLLANSQDANVVGKITKVEGDEITVVDTKNQSDTFILSKNVSIANYPGPGKVATPSSDISKIKLNVTSLIYLQLVNGDYQVVTINMNSYPAPTPSIRDTKIRSINPR